MCDFSDLSGPQHLLKTIMYVKNIHLCTFETVHVYIYALDKHRWYKQPKILPFGWPPDFLKAVKLVRNHESEKKHRKHIRKDAVWKDKMRNALNENSHN